MTPMEKQLKQKETHLIETGLYEIGTVVQSSGRISIICKITDRDGYYKVMTRYGNMEDSDKYGMRPVTNEEYLKTFIENLATVSLANPTKTEILDILSIYNSE